MKPMGLLPILLLLGVGITSMVAYGQISAYQTPVELNVPVGQTVDVTLQLTNVGSNATSAQILAVLPSGLATASPASWNVMLPPGNQQVIRYPVTATRSGDYTVVSQIAYTNEVGSESYLSMESALSATGGSPEGYPNSGPYPSGPGGYPEYQGDVPPYGQDQGHGPMDYPPEGGRGESYSSLNDPRSGVQDHTQSSFDDHSNDVQDNLKGR